MADNVKTMMTMFSIMLSISIGLAFLSLAVESYDTSTDTFYDSDTSPYTNYVDGDILSGSSKINDSLLPDQSAEATDGSDYYETVKGLNSWFRQGDMSTGLGFITSVIKQPGGFLVNIGVPFAIALAFQTLWGMIFLITFIAFIMGR